MHTLMAQDRNPYFTFTLITLLLVREMYPLDGIQIRPRDAQTQRNSTGKMPIDQLAEEIVQKHAAQAVDSNDVDQAGTNYPTTRAVQLKVCQLIINGNKFVTFNRTNWLITAVISDPLHFL